jgi:hypothetical protein
MTKYLLMPCCYFSDLQGAESKAACQQVGLLCSLVTSCRIQLHLSLACKVSANPALAASLWEHRNVVWSQHDTSALRGWLYNDHGVKHIVGFGELALAR